jgi:PadR family transcriptional regulator, regulatory protein PadR
MTKRRHQEGPRITLPTAAVLRQMLKDPSADYYGFALAEATAFPSGTIYPILARLEAAGWLVSFWEEGDPAVLERPRRRMYRLTGAGAHRARTALKEARRLLGGAAASRPIGPLEGTA